MRRTDVLPDAVAYNDVMTSSPENVVDFVDACGGQIPAAHMLYGPAVDSVRRDDKCKSPGPLLQAKDREERGPCRVWGKVGLKKRKK